MQSAGEPEPSRWVAGRLDDQSEGITVLHVDDDQKFAKLVAIYLERESVALDVVTETDPDDAIERLENQQIDCIVSDYKMHPMDGLEFLDAVRDRYPDLPFILFTGKGSEDIASEAISAGVTDYLQKGAGTDQYTVLSNRIRNVTQQHRATQEIKRSFRAIDTAREGIAFLDEEGTILYTNPAYAEVYGYEASELTGKRWEVLYPDDHVRHIYDEVLPSIPEVGRWSDEQVHVRKDGTRLLVNHALAYTEDGTLLCFIQDMTEQRETEAALERERRHFEQFVQDVEDYAIFALDTEGFVTSWNRGAERLKGYSRDEIIGQHFSVFYPEERARLGYPDTLLQRALKEGSVEDSGSRVRQDGTEFWANVVITPIRDDEGTHQGFLKVTRDMGTTDKAHSDRDGDGDFVDRALEILNDVFYVLDADGEIVRVSDRAIELTGYSREELLEMSPQELFAPEDRAKIQDDIASALDAGGATIEADVVTKSGRTIPFEFRKRRLTDEGGNVLLVGIGRDISERKRRERQLEQQLAQFEQFGSVLSHDLRTPLATARGRLELARETGDESHLVDAEQALKRLDELIDDLADVMREGELVGEIESVELARTFQGVWDTLPSEAATLTVETNAMIEADPEALKRLVENLFKNALEHAGDDVNVTAGALENGFYIEDDGPGIPEEKRARIFEAGFTTKSDGQGFGMASVRQLVVAHGWEITATAGHDGGARFEITDVETAENRDDD